MTHNMLNTYSVLLWNMPDAPDAAKRGAAFGILKVRLFVYLYTPMTILLLSLAGVIISIVVGTLWYSPNTPMGKAHMRFLGFDRLTPAEQQQKIAEAKPKMLKIYAAQMLLSFLTSAATVFIVLMSMQNGVAPSYAFGFVVFNWLCFMVPVVGGQLLWANVEASVAWRKFFSDISNHLVNILLIALLATFFV